jgi:hypothetical protein
MALNFLNVYGPNEYHKGRMASVIFHTVRQIKKTGGMKLFRSHRADVADGQQSRDFIYVKDVVNVIYWLYKALPSNGLYNLGTGKARSFWDLASNTFTAMGLAPNISFIDTPEDIRDTYQYFTEANMDKLKKAGYDTPFPQPGRRHSRLCEALFARRRDHVKDTFSVKRRRCFMLIGCPLYSCALVVLSWYPDVIWMPGIIGRLFKLVQPGIINEVPAIIQFGKPSGYSKPHFLWVSFSMIISSPIGRKDCSNSLFCSVKAF